MQNDDYGDDYDAYEDDDDENDDLSPPEIRSRSLNLRANPKDTVYFPCDVINSGNCNVIKQ